MISPSLWRAGTAGCGGIRGGGGARARARRRARREEGDDRWVPPVSESGGRARLSAARARAGRPMGRGEERERERGVGRAGPRRKGGGKKTSFRVFLFINLFNFVYFFSIIICALKIPLKFIYTF